MALTEKTNASQTLTSATLHILLALSGGELHGYGIMREIESLTSGKLCIGPGTLYRSIKQMLVNRLIEESDERPDPLIDDERRRYYRLTPLGRTVLTAELERLAEIIVIAQGKGLLAGGT